VKESTSIDINDILRKLRIIDESFINEGVSSHFLEFTKPDEENNFQIKGNSEGLIHFARSIIEVASKNMQGAHQHFDESGIVDKCDMPVTVSLKKSTW